MKNIRIKVFETNSSSTHSVSIYNATKGMYDTLTPNDLGQVVLTGGQFGWEWAQYNDTQTKANYAAVFALDSNLQSYVDMLVEVIKEHTGAKEVVLDVDVNDVGSNWSYVDHQSAYAEGGDAIRAFDTPATLKNFIFHPESWLFTGNDNDSAPPNFYDVEFGIEWMYQLEIDGTDITEKFQSFPDEEDLRTAIDRVMDRSPAYAYSYNYNSRARKKQYQLVSYNYKNSENDKQFSSYDKLNENVIILFQLEDVYKNDQFAGYKVLGQKEIKFNLKKL